MILGDEPVSPWQSMRAPPQWPACAYLSPFTCVLRLNCGAHYESAGCRARWGLTAGCCRKASIWLPECDNTLCSFIFLHFDQTVAAECRKDLGERRSSLGIDRRSAARRRDCGKPRANHLLPAENQDRTAQRTDFPGIGSKGRPDAVGLYKGRHAFERRDEPPARVGIGGQILSLAGPRSRRRRCDKIAGTSGG